MSATQDVGWESSPNGRGTFDIIWGCLTVLLICTYTVVHPNLLSPSEREARWPDPACLSAGIRQLRWMLITSIAPEIVIAMAIEDWAHANKSFREMRALPSGPLEPEWTMTHAFYAGMGGIALKFRDATRPLPLYGWQVTRLRNHNLVTRDRKTREVLLQTNILPRLVPDILPLAEIEDQNKADILVKGLAVVQASWLVVQTIGRAIQHLPISQLELATSGFVFCALVMYFFWWDKPFHIRKPKEIPFTNSRTIQRAVLEFLERDTRIYYGKGAWKRQWAFRRISNGKFVSNQIRSRQWLKLPMPLWWSVILGSIFSAIHMLAWNWSFPTTAEKTLWRICSTSTAVSCVLIGILLLISAQLRQKQRWPPRIGPFIGAWLVFFMGVYLVGRLIIIVQMFACFRKSPAGLYDTVDWSTYLPHFA